MNFKIKNRPIGDGFPCYISFEAGPTHDGMDSAIELVDQAADAGADAIKFQIIDADRLISNRDQQFSYTILRDKNTGETQEIKESLYKILKRRELQIGEWRKIKQHADLKGLAFFATIAFEDQIEEMQRLKIDSIKIASSDVNHHSLIRGAASTGMCIQLDTGSSSLGEIETAVDTVLSTGNDRIVIHQCPSGYPARLDGINLNMIKTLKTMFGVPVAYSDHTPGWIMDVAAVSIGANMVEKTITLDRATPSVEHIFSLEGKELVEFVNAIREVESAMGCARRMLQPEEILKRDSTRRSAFAKKIIEAGEQLSEIDIEYRRPGYGIQPSSFQDIKGKKAIQRIEKGVMLKPEFFS